MGAAFVEAIPSIRFRARQNRDFMLRVTRYLVGQVGIRQILDIGTGIPTNPNLLHEAAQEAARGPGPLCGQRTDRADSATRRLATLMPCL